MPGEVGAGQLVAGLGRLLLPGVLGAGAFEVLRQWFVVEAFADITGPEGSVASSKTARWRGLGDGQREQ